jgi:hypothetical protein
MAVRIQVAVPEAELKLFGLEVRAASSADHGRTQAGEDSALRPRGRSRKEGAGEAGKYSECRNDRSHGITRKVAERDGKQRPYRWKPQ